MKTPTKTKPLAPSIEGIRVVFDVTGTTSVQADDHGHTYACNYAMGEPGAVAAYIDLIVGGWDWWLVASLPDTPPRLLAARGPDYRTWTGEQISRNLLIPLPDGLWSHEKRFLQGVQVALVG